MNSDTNPQSSALNPPFVRDEPKPGERWQHFKGNEYFIIAIAYTLGSPGSGTWKRVLYSKSKHEDLWLSDGVIVFDTESNQVFDLEQVGSSNPEYALFLLAPSDQTWEESDKTDETIWARPLTDFMGVISDRHGMGASNCYRFERIDSLEEKSAELCA